MRLAEKIGTGKYRECFAIENSDLCAKKLKEIRPLIRFLTASRRRKIIQAEYDVFRRLPDELRDYFPVIYEKSGEYLICLRPKDFDGSFSRTLMECGRISNASFWDSIDKVAEMMVSHKIWLFDVFHIGDNIIVHRISDKVFNPVIIDFKRHGWASYPLQINLLLDIAKRRKLNRRLKKLKKRFLYM